MVLAGLERARADSSEPPVVVRDGAALLVRRSDVLVRVRPATDGTAVAHREVEVALVLQARGVPVTALTLPDDQPWEIDGSVVTAWRWIDTAGPADAAQMGSLARTLRERTVDDAQHVPACEPVEAVLAAVAHLPTDDTDARFVRGRAEELAGPWADAAGEDPLGRAIVHGDLHAGNVVVGPDGPLLTDLELTGGGPASYDVASPTVAVGRYGAPPESLEAFIDGFGADPRGWAGFDTFVAVDELWGTAWAVGVRHLDPAWADEATRRVESLRDGAQHQWRLS